MSARLTDLDIELARQFRVIASEVLQVPGKTPQRLSTFVSLPLAKMI